MNRRSARRPILFAAALAAAGVTLLPGIARAHHNDVSCQSPGIWLIVNSEVDKTETFTTDQGHSGTIGANDDGSGPHGQTTVAYSGTSLTVYGVWSNGVTNTATGFGDCTSPTTTSTVVVTTTIPGSTTTSTTSTTTSSTLPASSSTTTTPVSTSTTSPPASTTLPATSTTSPVTSSSVATTSTTSEPSSTLPGSTTTETTAPPTTAPVVSSTTLAPTTQPTTSPPPTTQPSGDCYSTSSTAHPTPTSTPTTPCETPSLPATGSDVTGWLIVAGFASACGLTAHHYGRKGRAT